ncbi:MAG: hypothetical protein PHP79_07020 [Clostridia bacterium]|nr:hypothetical protein [Clostridia bacterium]MDD4680622.1 hypothetical protein [Clostridia bacterium]
MKNLFSICLVLIFGFFSLGLAHAENDINEKQAIDQLVNELSLENS